MSNDRPIFNKVTFFPLNYSTKSNFSAATSTRVHELNFFKTIKRAIAHRHSRNKPYSSFKILQCPAIIQKQCNLIILLIFKLKTVCMVCMCLDQIIFVPFSTLQTDCYCSSAHLSKVPLMLVVRTNDCWAIGKYKSSEMQGKQTMLVIHFNCDLLHFCLLCLLTGGKKRFYVSVPEVLRFGVVGRRPVHP